MKQQGNGVEEALAESPVLFHLTAQERRLLASFMERCAFAAGEVIIVEGDTDEQMYVILSGEARVVRGGDVVLERLGRGAHFGELGLVARRPRSATVEAMTSLSAARLTGDGLRRLSRQEPVLAMRLLRELLGGVAERLSDVTEHVGVLLRERSTPRRATARVTLFGREQEVRTGTRIGSILPAELDGEPVVAGLLDHRAVSLLAPVSSDCSVKPLTTAHFEGRRIYKRSVALVLLEAAARIDRDLVLRVDQPIGVAQHVLVEGVAVEALEPLVTALQAEMERIVAEDHPLREELWTVEEAQEHFAHVGWRDAWSLLSMWRDDAVPLVSYGEVFALRTGALLASTGRIGSFRVLVNSEQGLLLAYGDHVQSALEEPRKSMTRTGVLRAVSKHAMSLSREHDRWLRAVGITSVGEFNEACVTGDVDQLIRVSEGFQEKRLGQIADAIAARRDAVRVICVAGPSSSGKTTFIKRLSVQLQVNGLHPVGLSLDDYYVDREATPLGDDGEYDFEAFEALRVELLQEHLRKMVDGELVRTAKFVFAEGKSYPEGGHLMRLRDEDILILEGIHGLNPGLLSSIPDEQIFRIFICPLAQLPFDHLSRVHASDVRLIRRVVRDRHSRGFTAARNINMWPKVRRGERRNIFPYQDNNDAVFDSSLIYEASVLKVFAERYLLEVRPDDPAYTTAFRLLQLLDRFVTIYPDHVPPTSLLREFIGGSGFEY